MIKLGRDDHKVSASAKDHLAFGNLMKLINQADDVDKIPSTHRVKYVMILVHRAVANHEPG